MCSPAHAHACQLSEQVLQSLKQSQTQATAVHDNSACAEGRVLWYSSEFRDWDVTNGSLPQSVRSARLLYLTAVTPITAATAAQQSLGCSCRIMCASVAELRHDSEGIMSLVLLPCTALVSAEGGLYGPKIRENSAEEACCFSAGAAVVQPAAVLSDGPLPVQEDVLMYGGDGAREARPNFVSAGWKVASEFVKDYTGTVSVQGRSSTCACVHAAPCCTLSQVVLSASAQGISQHRCSVNLKVVSKANEYAHVLICVGPQT